MTIWKKQVTPDQINQIYKGTMSEYLAIEVTRIDENHLEGIMPVSHKTKQSFGILHGGASVALAETLGSTAGNLCVDDDAYCVGMEINANHLASVSSGKIIGKASPLHLGRSTHVWEIRMYREDGQMSCISRHTLAVLKYQHQR